MIRAIAIDDEPLALQVIERFCAQLDFITLEKTFIKPTEALKYVGKFPVDLLFLDINMPSLSGIDLYKSIRQDAAVIFTTAYSEYAVEGFDLSAIDYLLKPFTFERFVQAANKAHDHFKHRVQKEPEGHEHLLIRADYTLHKIALTDVLYVEGLDDYVKIHQANGKLLVARMTIKAMLKKLPVRDFIRVHRSYIVRISHIDGIRNKTILLAGREIPIGSSYEKDFYSVFKS